MKVNKKIGLFIVNIKWFLVCTKSRNKSSLTSKYGCYFHDNDYEHR